MEYNWIHCVSVLKKTQEIGFAVPSFSIPWNELYSKNVEAHDKINEYKEQNEEKDIAYPDYYLRPFHGYDQGNMIWKGLLMKRK